MLPRYHFSYQLILVSQSHLRYLVSVNMLPSNGGNPFQTTIVSFERLTSDNFPLRCCLTPSDNSLETLIVRNLILLIANLLNYLEL